MWSIIKQVIEENKHNMKKSWQLIQEVLGKKNKKDQIPQIFNIDGKQVSDRTQLTESFNQYFSNIGRKTSENVPP